MRMTTHLHWEDVNPGDELPSLSKIASTRSLVLWAGASNDFNPLHYENSFAESQGMDRAIVHGQLKLAWLVQLVTDWIGDSRGLKKIHCRFTAVDYPRVMKTITEPQDGETWSCRGRVTGKNVEDGRGYVDCQVWVENGRGTTTVVGTATCLLPYRRQKTSD